MRCCRRLLRRPTGTPLHTPAAAGVLFPALRRPLHRCLLLHTHQGVIITPHVYPPTITGNTFLGAELYGQCRTAFGYLQTTGYCTGGACTRWPVLVGETGSAMSNPTDVQWLNDFAEYVHARVSAGVVLAMVGGAASGRRVVGGGRRAAVRAWLTARGRGAAQAQRAQRPAAAQPARPPTRQS
jgi:hypothetical protein